jgi:hypothetical protein
MDMYPHEAPGNGRFFVGNTSDRPKKRVTSCRRALFPLIGLILLAAVFPGCSSSEPEIMQVDMRIIATYSPEDGTIREHLQVRLDIHDPDGIEEISSLTVIHESTGLFWTVDSSEARRHSRDGQEWFGFDLYPVSGNRRVPRGTFRVETEDLSGRQGNRTVSIPLNTPTAGPESFGTFQGATLNLPVNAGSTTEEKVYLFRRPSEPEDAEEPEHVYLLDLSEHSEPIVDRELLPGDLRPGQGEVWVLREAGRYIWYRSGPW